jgi:hypothetical protein
MLLLLMLQLLIPQTYLHQPEQTPKKSNLPLSKKTTLSNPKPLIKLEIKGLQKKNDNRLVNNTEITQTVITNIESSCKEQDLPVCLFTAEKHHHG